MKFKYKKLLSSLLLIILALITVGCKKDPVPEGPLELDTSLTDSLKLNKTFDGKDFIKDGIGEVELNRFVDGDTISVRSSEGIITIRFLGINTPESTAKVEPWGKSASKFVKDTLAEATSIVLEAEGERKDSTNKRYLAWVWYKTASSDYRLLNLEEVELAYTRYMFKEDSTYHATFLQANEKASKSLKRIWGETDPDYNYSRDVVQTSLLYMLDHPSDYQTGTKFELNVKLVRTVGNNMFLQDANEVSYDEDGEVITGKGSIYCFSGYIKQYYMMYKPGDIFTITVKFEYEGSYGTQLTDITKISSVKNNETPEIPEIDANLLDGGASLEQYYGQVIQLKNLVVSRVQTKTTANNETYYVVEAKNKDNKVFDIYFSNSLITPHKVPEIFKVGEVYDIIGGVAKVSFSDDVDDYQYQLSVGDAPRYNNGVLDENDVLRINDIKKIG